MVFGIAGTKRARSSELTQLQMAQVRKWLGMTTAVVAAEFEFVEGSWNGPHRFYMNGELIAEEFYINNSKTTKRKYLQLCETNPKLPKYVQRQPSNRKSSPSTRPNQPPRRDEVNETVFDHLLGGPEARSWLHQNKSKRSLGESADYDFSMEIVNDLYTAGATRVLVGDIRTYEDELENASTLVVYLPKDVALRKRVLDAAHQPDAAGFDPEPDTNQDFVVVMLD